MFEIFTHGFTFLNLLSIVAFLTTVGLFFCGIPICRQIWKRKDTKEISGAPFLMGIVGGCCWLTYGYLKSDYTVMVVTGAQVFLYTSYTTFYWFMSKEKLGITLKVLGVLTICASLFASVYFLGHKVFHPLGIICMTLNIGDFAAPLAGLKTVIRRGATSTLPLPLCIANFLVSSEWFLYGLLVWDFYLITPNGIGSLLALAQVLLFVFLPRKPGQRPPYKRLFDCCCRKGKVADVETAEVVPDDDVDCEKKKDIGRSWSKRVITNLENELENVITKVTAHDQFAYLNDLNNSEPSSDNSSEQLDVEVKNEVVPEKSALDNFNALMESRVAVAKTTGLKRSNSSPDLTQ